MPDSALGIATAALLPERAAPDLSKDYWRDGSFPFPVYLAVKAVEAVTSNEMTGADFGA